MLITLDGDTAYTFSELEPCEKDDLTHFKKDGTAVDDDGATKCDPADPQTESYLWSFLTNETELQLNFGMGDVQVYDILTNDGTTLKIETTEVESFPGRGDVTSIGTITYTAQ